MRERILELFLSFNLSTFGAHFVHSSIYLLHKEKPIMRQKALALLVVLMLLYVYLPVQAENTISLKFTLSKQSVDAAKGENVRISWQVQDGSEPYEYICYQYVVDDGKEQMVKDFWYIPDTAIDFAPRFGQSGYIVLMVYDRATGSFLGGSSGFSSPMFTITGSPPVAPLELFLTLSKETIDLSQGESIQASLSASGGEEPYTYTIMWAADDPTGEVSFIPLQTYNLGSNTTSSFKPTYGNRCIVMAGVTDSKGRRESRFDSALVVGKALTEPMTISMSLDKQSVKANSGEEITASWIIVGGIGPYSRTSVETSISDDGVNWEAVVNQTQDGSSYSFAPERGKFGKIKVWKMDSQGDYVEGNVTFTITEGIPEELLHPGDATNDGTIDILDLVLIIDYIVSNTDPTSPANADANGDGTVDILDLVWIIDQIVGG
jgi:hypothetical protein